MATKVRKRTSQKQIIRYKHKVRIRARLEGTSERPRLSIFRSNKFIYAQIINDEQKATIASASTLEEELRGKHGKSIESAKVVGQLIAKRALAKNIGKVCFDRSGYIYHGRVKALADAAREAGLQF